VEIAQIICQTKNHKHKPAKNMGLFAIPSTIKIPITEYIT